jgi:hypothetical protein
MAGFLIFNNSIDVKLKRILNELFHKNKCNIQSLQYFTALYSILQLKASAYDIGDKYFAFSPFHLPPFTFNLFPLTLILLPFTFCLSPFAFFL